MQKMQKRTSLILLFTLSFIVQILISFLPGFEIDLNAFRFWSLKLVEAGPWNFYSAGFFADYAPGYLYILGFLGIVAKVFHIDSASVLFTLLLKFPSITFDMLGAFLLFKLLENQKRFFQIGATSLYLFHPAVLFIGPIWGQIDSALSFFLLLTCYLLIKNRPIQSGITLILAFWIKPQAIAVFPIFLFFLLKNYPWPIFLKSLVGSFFLSLLIITPFFPTAPWMIIGQLSQASEVYPYTSFFAYNFWAVFGMFGSDAINFLGLTLRNWGFILFFLSILPLLVFLKKPTPFNIALGFSISILAFFLFVTRMHERYLFPFILLFLLTSSYGKTTLLWLIFWSVSIVHFLNLYAAYSYYNDTIVKVVPLFQIASLPVLSFSLFILFSFILLIFISVKGEGRV